VHCSSLVLVALFMVLASSPHAQQAGSQPACASCHREALSEPETEMGRALQSPGHDSILKSNPTLKVEKGTYTYTVDTTGNMSTYSVTDGSRTISVPLQWNFGAVNQSWVLEWNGNFYESLVSYYASIGGLDTTTGDEQLMPKSLEEAFGRQISVHDAKACFGCHTTNAVVGTALNLGGLHPGLGCARCHNGTDQHLVDMVRGGITSVPQSLAKLTSGEQANFCGQCHRTWEMTVRSHWRGEMTVRFQPYRLENSRCFNGNDSRIGCLACHNPHQPLSHDTSFYDSKCLACHAASATAHPVVAAKAPIAKACPVAASKCVTCHMPRTRMLGGHLVFTDHEIRIVKPGSAYPN
jgi:hypothetical protein